MLPKNAYGSRIKNYVTPAYFRFGKHEIEIGDQLTRVLFIKEYSTYVDDEMINDIIDNSEKITVKNCKVTGYGYVAEEDFCFGADYPEAYGAKP